MFIFEDTRLDSAGEEAKNGLFINVKDPLSDDYVEGYLPEVEDSAVRIEPEDPDDPLNNRTILNVYGRIFLNDWEIKPGSVGGVTSVNGKTGEVILDATDVGATTETWVQNQGYLTATSTEVTGKQDKVIAGNHIEIGSDEKTLSANFDSEFNDIAVNFADIAVNKQDTLVSGTNIKTVGGQSILGSGNIEAGGLPTGTATGNALVYVDSEWVQQSGYGYEAVNVINAVETITLTDAGGYGIADLGTTYLQGLKAWLNSSHVGETVKVTLDNNNYNVAIQEYSGAYIIQDSAPTFAIRYEPSSSTYMLALLSSASSCSIGVSQSAVVQFDPKYISEDGYGYISNNSKKEFTFTWDGDTTGKTTHTVDYMKLYKVDDTVYSVDDIIGCIGSGYLAGTAFTSKATTDNVTYDSHGGAILYSVSLSDRPICIFSDGSYEYDGTTFEAGLWFFKGSSTYMVSELTSIHMIDTKYLPDTDISGAVRYDVAQSLTTDEKMQARKNQGLYYTEPAQGSDGVSWTGDYSGRDYITDTVATSSKIFGATKKDDLYLVSDKTPSLPALMGGTLWKDNRDLSRTTTLSTSNTWTFEDYIVNCLGGTITSGDASKLIWILDNGHACVALEALTIEYNDGSEDRVITAPKAGVYLATFDTHNYYCPELIWPGCDEIDHKVETRYIQTPEIVVSSSQVISSSPITIQLTDAQYALIENEDTSIIKFDGSDLGMTSLSYWEKAWSGTSTIAFENPYLSPDSHGVITVSKNTKIATYEAIPNIPYVTTAPTSANTTGLKFAVLSSEPATKYDGWIYFITA